MRSWWRIQWPWLSSPCIVTEIVPSQPSCSLSIKLWKCAEPLYLLAAVTTWIRNSIQFSFVKSCLENENRSQIMIFIPGKVWKLHVRIDSSLQLQNGFKCTFHISSLHFITKLSAFWFLTIKFQVAKLTHPAIRLVAQTNVTEKVELVAVSISRRLYCSHLVQWCVFVRLIADHSSHNSSVTSGEYEHCSG